MTSGRDERLAEGRAALRVGDASSARHAFEQAYAVEPSGDALDGLAQAAYLEQDFRATVGHWEHAYSAYRDAGDFVAAARAARSLSYIYGAFLGEYAIQNGWIGRAQTLLGGSTESKENGWVALNRGMFEGDPDRREANMRVALEMARRFGDVELELVSLSYLGACLVHRDRTDAGMALLDEALAAVAGFEVDDFLVLQEIFCQLFAACEHAKDVGRADQWIRIGSAIAEKRNLPEVSAFCRMHYGGLLTVAGRWSEADAALTEAVRIWALGPHIMYPGTVARLAALRVQQGRIEEAESLLAALDVNAETAVPMAAVRLARGDTSSAREILVRTLAQVDSSASAAAPLWALLVDVHLAAGDLSAAQSTVETMVEAARVNPNDYLAAAAALARGRVCLATGTSDPLACLREALEGFTRAQMPIEAAHTRLEIATALVEERPDAAVAEARAALVAFDRLSASRYADAAAALLRSLGVRVTTVNRVGGLLTKRESEVLELLGHGLSNPEIAERLFISRKTVEHHVSNVLSKLGLRTRGEAAAFALKAGSARE